MLNLVVVFTKLLKDRGARLLELGALFWICCAPGPRAAQDSPSHGMVAVRHNSNERCSITKEMIDMDNKRTQGIFDSLGVIEALHRGAPVWIENAEDEHAEIKYLDSRERLQAPVSELSEDE